MRVLDTFSGIGGFSLGLERAGFETVAFSEIDEYASKVLAKHWPEIKNYGDIKGLTAGRLASDGIGVDIITGGFPCQDTSQVGHVWGAPKGTDGLRTGLWSELSRLISEVKPRYAILENVSNLLVGDGGKWFGRILNDLAQIGFDAEWHCISASTVGAPHQRERVWIIAYPRSEGLEGCSKARNDGSEGQESRHQLITRCDRVSRRSWEAEPAVCRVVNGIPHRSHRIRCLGNAIVPQIAELIGRQILAYEAERHGIL